MWTFQVGLFRVWKFFCHMRSWLYLAWYFYPPKTQILITDALKVSDDKIVGRLKGLEIIICVLQKARKKSCCCGITRFFSEEANITTLEPLNKEQKKFWFLVALSEAWSLPGPTSNVQRLLGMNLVWYPAVGGRLWYTHNSIFLSPQIADIYRKIEVLPC